MFCLSCRNLWVGKVTGIILRKWRMFCLFVNKCQLFIVVQLSSFQNRGSATRKMFFLNWKNGFFLVKLRRGCVASFRNQKRTLLNIPLVQGFQLSNREHLCRIQNVILKVFLYFSNSHCTKLWANRLERYHCVKGVRIQSYSDPHSDQMQENTN